MANSPLVNFLGAIAVVGTVATCVSLANAPRAHGNSPTVRTIRTPRKRVDTEPTIAPVNNDASVLSDYEIYETAVTKHAEDMGRSYAMTLCGLESQEWLSRVAQTGDMSMLNEPHLRAIRQRLSSSEYARAEQAANDTMKEVEDSYLSRPNPRIGCARLAKETGLTSDLMSP